MGHRLLCTGDPILDLYIDGTNEMRRFNGGALNINQNIVALLEEHWFAGSNANIQFVYPNDSECLIGDIFTLFTIVRTPLHPEGVQLASPREKTTFYEPSGINEKIQEFKPTILVLADYNKGTLNTSYEQILPKTEIAIVDSRYRSLDLYWIQNCQLKIWHATAQEYDKEWASNFDYVYWTDGPNPVRILRNNKIIATLEVPKKTRVINTCGAGDTFTATIAASLFANEDYSEQAMISYGKYAIDVCQDTVSQPYTSITNKRIQRECTLQI